MIQDTNPSSVEQASTEDITWGVDVSALLSGDETPGGATAALTSPTGRVITLADSATVSGNIIEQRIRASVLTKTSQNPYILVVTFTPSGTSNVLAQRLEIVVPF